MDFVSSNQGGSASVGDADYSDSAATPLDTLHIPEANSNEIRFTAEDVLQYSCNPTTLMQYLEHRFLPRDAEDKRRLESLVSLELPSTSGFDTWELNSHWDTLDRFKSLTRINLSNTKFKSIRNFLVSGCKSVTEINLPDTVREVHSSAFAGCTMLSVLTFRPELKTSVYHFGENVFKGCTKLPSEVKEGWRQTFDGHLTEAHLSKFGSTIPQSEFSGRHDIVRVDIPASVLQIGDFAFSRCENLAIVTFSPKFSGGIGPHAFKQCSAIETINLPGSTRAIGRHAFVGCLKLATFTFPPQLKKTIHLFADEVFEKGGACCDISPLSADIKEGWEPTGELVAADLAQYGSSIPGQEESEAWTFREDVKTMHFPDTVREIRCGAFQFMKVERVVLPPHLRILRHMAFSDCPNLKEVVLNASLREIESHAFDNCKNLTSLIFPPALKTSLLHFVPLTDSVNVWPASAIKPAFSGCTALPAEVKKGWTSTGIYTAKDLEHFGSVIPHVDYGGFSGRLDVKIITIPACITNIEGTFDHCENLMSLTLPPYLKLIGSNLLKNCVRLKELVVPASVREIHENAFEGCINLETLIIFRPHSSTPDDLVISKDAFYNCAICGVDGPTTLEEVYSNERLSAAERIHFVPNLKTLSAPDSVVAAFAAPHVPYYDPENRGPLDTAYKGYSTLADLPAKMTCNSSKIQLDTYFWSLKLYCNTDILSLQQRAWVKNFLTCGSRARLHWRPPRNVPKSEACKPTPEHAPLPCILNDVLLLVLPFIKLCELGPAPPYQPPQ